jgi:superfamily II DNA or RNA helicase
MEKKMICLRDYQEDALTETRNASREGLTRLMAVLPTGSGKTIIFSELAKRSKRKTLILAHRDELIHQAADKVKMVWPEAAVGTVKGRENDFHHKNVVCASVQTLARKERLGQLLDEEFGLLVIDEAHRSMAQTYRDIIEVLGFGSNDPRRVLFGCTATPSRQDRKGLGHIFQKIVYSISLLTMIRAGYLSDIRGYRAQTETDLANVGIKQGDLIESQLAQLVNTKQRNELVVKSYCDYAPGRKALAFCADIRHAEDLAGMFSAEGISARALSGATPANERAEALKAFSRGEIQVLTNCALFTEGFDEPSIDCILMCRPTKSQALYTQCVGRGTRRHPGKQDCVVIDFCDNRHDICGLPELLGWDKDGLENGKSVISTVRELEEEEGKRKTGEQLSLDLPPVFFEEFDLLSRSNFRWLFDGQQWRLPVAPGVQTLLVPDGAGRFQAFLIQKDDRPELLHPMPLDLGYGQGICEDYVRRSGGQIFAAKNAKWRSIPATEKQINLLRRIGGFSEGITKGRADELITQFFAKKNAGKISRQLAGVK